MFGRSSQDLPNQVRRLVAAQDQLFRVSSVVCDDGPAAGARMLEVHNPAGISFEVFADRCLDIGWADALGIPVAWTSARGDVASVRYEPQGAGWVRTFPGGLLATCGLESTGMPSKSGGVAYGLHDRIGHIPAENVTWRVDVCAGWAGGVGEGSARVVQGGADGHGTGRVIVIEGDVTQTGLGCANLALHRTIMASTQMPRIEVTDVVTNRGYRRAGHMMRHHLNLGYPLVGPGSVLDSEATIVGGRDGKPSVDSFPIHLDVRADAHEEVLYCVPPTGAASCGTRVTAPDGSWIRIEQQTDGWSQLVVWRDASEGVNVLGVEPSMSRDAGRAQAERDGEVIWLEPGEDRRYVTRIEVGGR